MTSIHWEVIVGLLLISLSYCHTFHIKYHNAVASKLFADNIPDIIRRTVFTGTGCVLQAKPSETNQEFIRKSIFIFLHGDQPTQGVFLSSTLPFTLGDTSPVFAGPFSRNRVYNGGPVGGGMAIMLHPYELDGAKYVGNGIYLGSMAKAKDFVKNEYSSAAEFKFFLNHCEWPKGELEKEIANGRWDVVEVPPDVVLMNDPTKSSWDSINDSLKAACQ